MRKILSLVTLLLCLSVRAYGAEADTSRSVADLLNRLDVGSKPVIAQQVRDVVVSMSGSAETIADVRAIEPSPNMDGAVVRALGYTTAFDHGGVNYRYDAACVDSDTAGTVLVPDVGAGCWRIVYPDPGKVDVRYFGVQAAPGVNNATALQRAADATVRLYFPAGEYETDGTFFPKRGFVGDGLRESTIKAQSNFSGTENSNGDTVLVSLGSLGREHERFADIALHGNEGTGADVILGTTLAENSNHKCCHRFDRVWLLSNNAGGKYVIDFKNGTGSFSGALTGSVWSNVSVQSGTGSGLLRVEGPMGDQMTWIGARWAMGNSGTVAPVIVESFGATFIETFFSVGNGFTAGAAEKNLITFAGSRPQTWIGLDFENGAGSTPANIEHIFRMRTGTGDPTLLVSQLSYGGGVDPLASGEAIVWVENNASGITGLLEFSGVTVGGSSSHWRFPAFLEVRQVSGHTNGVLQFRVNGVNQFTETLDELVSEDTSSNSTSGVPAVHISGNLQGMVLDHVVDFDGVASAETPKHASPRIATNDNLDLIAANAAVWRITCPFDLTVQKASSVLNAALATGDATITMAIEGVNITGGVITVTQSGSAAGDKDSATPTGASNDNDCDAGETLTLTVGGTSTAGNAGLTVELAPRAA